MSIIIQVSDLAGPGEYDMLWFAGAWFLVKRGISLIELL